MLQQASLSTLAFHAQRLCARGELSGTEALLLVLFPDAEDRQRFLDRHAVERRRLPRRLQRENRRQALYWLSTRERRGRRNRHAYREPDPEFCRAVVKIGPVLTGRVRCSRAAREDGLCGLHLYRRRRGDIVLLPQ